MRRRFAPLGELFASDFVRHGLIVFASTMLVNGFGYAFHFAISRRVGVEQYGALSALNAVYMLSLVVSTIVATVVVKYAAEFRALDDRAHLAALVRRLAFYGGAAAAAVVVVALAATPALAAYLKIGSIPVVACAMALVGISTLTPSLRGVFQGLEDFGAFAVSAVMESTLKAVLGIGLVYAGFGILGAFAGWLAGAAITLAYTLAVLLRRFAAVPGATLHVDFRRLATTMANVAVATIFVTSMSYADVIVVKHFADATTAGLYGALSLTGKILFFLVGFVPTIVLPKASRLALGGRSPVGVLLKALGVIVLLAGAGLVAYDVFPAAIVTTLAGASFAPAAPYVFAYGVAMVLLAILNVVVTYKIGIHRFDFLVPLGLCAIAEIVGIFAYHRSLTEVILVLIAGNAVALLGSAYRINAAAPAHAAVTRSAAA